MHLKFLKNVKILTLNIGIKDKGIPLEEMVSLYNYMKQCGKNTVLK